MQIRVYATLRDLVGSSVIELDVPGPTDARRSPAGRSCASVARR